MREFYSIRISRRAFLASASASLLGCAISPSKPDAPPDGVGPNDEFTFRLYRAEDRFSCMLTVRGFYVQRRHGNAFLVAHPQAEQLLLIFEFPPQHNAETAIDRPAIKPKPGETFEVSAQRITDQVARVGYLSSKPAILVFHVPRNRKALPERGRAMRLSLEHLLAWDQFEYVREDATDPYGPFPHSDGKMVQPNENPDPTLRYLLGLERWKGVGAERVSAIDLPTGFYLQPRGDQAFEWRMRPFSPAVDDYMESWSAFMVGRTYPQKLLPSIELELVDIHGVAGGEGNATMQRTYAAYPPEAKQYDPTAIDFYDRMELAVTLSPRFGTTKPPVAFSYSEAGANRVDDCNVPPKAIFQQCFIGLDHVLTATTYGISADGGYLDFEGTWSVRPGCTVKGWVHKTHRGRDTFVKVTRKGWLNLHGFELELIEETERTYLRDIHHRLVAPMVKQVYIRVVQPADILAASPEEGFTRITLKTLRTPPLDLYVNSSGNNDPELKELDAFIPHVEGKPFEWEFSATDHAGNTHTWTQPGYFISNRQLSDDDFGRFPEDATSPVPHNGLGGGKELHYIQVTTLCRSGYDTTPGGPFVSNFIKLVDLCWSQLPYRFAELHGASVAIAPYEKSGDTTIEMKWIEWVRGVRPEPLPTKLQAGREAVVRPIRSRIRTARFALPTLRQFSGDVPDMLGTYRDLRAPCQGSLRWSLDPEEKQDFDTFHLGVLQPNASENASGAFFCVLPTDAPSPDELLRVYFQAFQPKEYARLFESLSHGVSFGKSKTTEGLGGLATPDCPVALLTRKFGPVGDKNQTFSAVSQCLPMGTSLVTGGPLRFTAVNSGDSPGAIHLAGKDLFGDDGEILPGVKFKDVLNFIFASGGNAPVAAGSNLRSNTLQWQTNIVGLEWLTNLLSTLESVDVDDLLRAIENQPPSNEPAEPIRVGIESTLSWSTQDLQEFGGSVFKFYPNLDGGQVASFDINARAWLDALDPKPELSANCRLSSFALEFFSAIKVNFDYVQFSLDAQGNKRFNPSIVDVTFSGPLAFLDLLKDLLKQLGDEYGIKISITPQRAMVSQVLSFPLDGSGVVYLGPAAISNLSFQWGVIIPILGRDHTRVFVGLASRESPMVISVGIYGGRAYALVEADTSGPRLVEISADYGGVFQAAWGVAKGSVSLTAGFTFTWLLSPKKQIKLFAFAQFSGSLSIGRIFSVCAHIMVSMGYVDDDQGGDEIIGFAECSCSFKLGIAEYSYSYTAQRSEKAGPGSGGGGGGGGGGVFHALRLQDLSALAFAAIDDKPSIPIGVCGPPEDKKYFDAFYPLARPSDWQDYFSASA